MSDETFATAADFFAAEDAQSGGRKIDEKATKIARLKQQRGIDALKAAFGLMAEQDEDGVLRVAPHAWETLHRANQVGDSTGRGKPVRLKKGCPPVRDHEHARRHRLRKISHESRRRNRP